VVTGLVLDGTGFELLAGGERLGSRRVVGPGEMEFLAGLAGRYSRAVHAGRDDGALIGLGRDLYRWLDGDQGQLDVLLERAARPVVFEVAGPWSPSEAGWAVLRAPFELLAQPGGGFLAEDELARFCVVRRLGPQGDRPGLGGFRLGLAFMASSPRGQHELDFEAEEAAILRAVGETRLDLLVEDTGDPEQLAHRLAGTGGMPVVHLSCHGLNNWQTRPGDPGVPVLMMEDETGAGRPTTAGDLAGLLTGVPRLVFVSACLTATGADAGAHLPPGNGHKGDPGAGGAGLVAHSLATALVAAGFPAVLGWDGSVEDRAATAFAGRLYRALADRGDLAVAVGDARRVLLESPDPVVRGGLASGPVVAGPGWRRSAGRRHPETFPGPGDSRYQDVPGPQAAGAGGGGGDVRGAAAGAAAGAKGPAVGGAGGGAAARAGAAGQVQPGRPDHRPVPRVRGGGGVRRLRRPGHRRRHC
jgi:hypothetical protein